MKSEYSATEFPGHNKNDKLQYYWQKIRGLQISHNNVRIDNFLNPKGQPKSVLDKKSYKIYQPSKNEYNISIGDSKEIGTLRMPSNNQLNVSPNSNSKELPVTRGIAAAGNNNNLSMHMYNEAASNQHHGTLWRVKPAQEHQLCSTSSRETVFQTIQSPKGVTRYQPRK